MADVFVYQDQFLFAIFTVIIVVLLGKNQHLHGLNDFQFAHQIAVVDRLLHIIYIVSAKRF